MKCFTAGACLLVLMLGACGSGDEDYLTADKIEASESAPELPEVALSNEPEPEPLPAPATPPMLENMANEVADNSMLPPEELPRINAIPASMQGLWAMSAEDCELSDADTRLSVSAGQLRFFEYSGRLLRAEGSYPERFIGVFGYEGEGRRWTERNQLVLSSSSNSLILVTPEGQESYRRC